MCSVSLRRRCAALGIFSKERVMGIQGRRAGVAALVLMGVLGLSGCVMTESGYQPLNPQLAGGCPTCPRGGVLSKQAQPIPFGMPGGEVVQTAYQPGIPAPGPEGEVVQTAYRPLAGRLGGLRTGMHTVDSPV